MPSYVRQMLIFLAFLILGILITAPGFAKGPALAGTPHLNMKGENRDQKAPVVPVKPRLLDLKPMPAMRLTRLNKDARVKYDLAMNFIDRINYERAVDAFQQAVALQPDDVYLRFMVVQLTQYLGDTRTGPDSIKYYDVTIENLKAMADSTTLNTREKQRAQSALAEVVVLRQSIGEREGKRHQWGQEIAKQYSSEIFKDMDKAERERAQKKEQVEGYVKEVNTAPGVRPGARAAILPARSAAVTRSSGNYSMQSAPRAATRATGR